MSILVTGGTKGIGLAIALRLAKPGEELFLVYHRDEAAAADAKLKIEKTGATTHLIKSDVGSIEEVRSLMNDIQVTSGELDHIVHAAATIYPTTLLDADLEKFSKAIETNGLSLLYLVQRALPLLRDGSSIVFISSLGAHATNPRSRYAALGTGKALAEADLETLQHEAEVALIKTLADWPRTVESAALAHEPHRIAYYLDDLAAQFHALWNLGTENSDLRFLIPQDVSRSRARLALIQGVAQVIASGLEIMGVEPVEEMR